MSPWVFIALLCSLDLSVSLDPPVPLPEQDLNAVSDPTSGILTNAENEILLEVHSIATLLSWLFLGTIAGFVPKKV